MPRFSRRSFLHLSAAASAAATFRIWTEPMLAAASRRRPHPADAVMIDSNENPLGPSQSAREAMAAIEKYDWPGNVRELKNALERSVVLCRGDEIGVQDLPGEVVHGEAISVKHRGDENDNGIGERDFREAKRKFEVAYLSRQLAEHRWNVSRTAATIGLHRQSLQEKLRELGIRRPGREPLEEE